MYLKAKDIILRLAVLSQTFPSNRIYIVLPGWDLYDMNPEAQKVGRNVMTLVKQALTRHIAVEIDLMKIGNFSCASSTTFLS